MKILNEIELTDQQVQDLLKISARTKTEVKELVKKAVQDYISRENELIDHQFTNYLYVR